MADPTADLASRLNSRRRRLGIGVGDLARRMDASRSTVEFLITGKRTPTPAQVEKLIAILDLDDEFAHELRGLDVSFYKSGFASGPVRLTDETDQ